MKRGRDPLTRNGRDRSGRGNLKGEHRQTGAHTLAGNRERTCARIEKDSGGATLKGGDGAQKIAGMDGGGSAPGGECDRNRLSDCPLHMGWALSQRGRDRKDTEEFRGGIVRVTQEASRTNDGMICAMLTADMNKRTSSDHGRDHSRDTRKIDRAEGEVAGAAEIDMIYHACIIAQIAQKKIRNR